MSPTTGRKKYLDAAKGLGITLIVFGHTTRIGNPLDRYFSTYKISIFFLVSGFLIFMTGSLKKYTVSEYLRKHFQSLLLPYFLYSILIAVFQGLMDLYNGSTMGEVAAKIAGMGYKCLTFRGYSTLWFLPCLFFGQMLFFLIWRTHSLLVKISGMAAACAGTAAFAVLLPLLQKALDEQTWKFVSYPLLTIGKALMACGFIAAGYIFAMLHEKIRSGRIRFAAGAVLSLVPVFGSRHLRSTDLNNLYFGISPVLFLVCSLAGAAGAILVLEGLERWLPMPYLTWAGRNSLIIMATHGPFRIKNLIRLGWEGMYTVAETAGLRYYLDTAGMVVCIMLMESGVVSIINRYFPVLAGKGLRKRGGRVSEKDP